MGKLKGLTTKIGDCAYAISVNLVKKPILLIKHILHPGRVISESYFPELPSKSRMTIWTEQAMNILRHGSTDEYYYMYGHDVKGLNNPSEYVLYKVFMDRRDALNLSDPHNDSCILRNKIFFASVARTIGVDTPALVASTQDGMIHYLDGSSSDDAEWNGLHRYDGSVLYSKPLDGQNGEGILRLEITPEFDTEELHRRLSKGRFLIQEQIIQHDEMSRIYPGAVNTIRLTTVRNRQSGEIEYLPATLRIGAHGNVMDNFSQGGIIVAIDMATGRLDEVGFCKPTYGLKSRRHPDTDVEYSSFVVPFFEAAKAKAKYFHSFLNLHSIGWDIAIGPDGPIFIEGNDNWEINLPQTAFNPFLSEFRRLFK